MPNVLQASFPRRNNVRGLEKVTVRQVFDHHTLAFLDYQISDKKDYLLPPENAPVQIRWGSSPVGVRGFHGYVNHYETLPDAAGRAMTRLVAIGTSKRMNTMNTSSWQGATRSAIVRDIAARHRLRSVVHDHPYVMEHWATGTRSDFACLKVLAEEIGYRMWVDGATVWFLDPTKMLRTASTMVTPHLSGRDIRHIEVLGGSNIPGVIEASRRRVQFGLDYNTNEFFEVSSGSPGDPTEVIPNAVTTLSEAQQIEDAASRKQRDNLALKATINGNARLYPGALLRVESGRVNNDQGGLWLVNETTHEITQKDFTTRLLGTRSQGQFPLVRTTSTLREAPGLTQTVIRDGVTWEAALQEHVHV